MRNQEFNGMSNRSNAVLAKCEYNVSFCIAKNNLAEWCGSYSNRRCNDLNDLYLYLLAHILIQHVNEDCFWLYSFSLLFYLFPIAVLQ